MKLTLLVILSVIASLIAQAQTPIDRGAITKPLELDITMHKTTMLIFPAPILSADRGDSYVLAQKVKGAENVLKVKAGSKDFEPSNLQVLTTDGKVYPFEVHYADQPAAYTIDLRKQPPNAPITFEGLSLNSKQLEDYATMIIAKPFLRRGSFHAYGMSLQLRAVYIKDDALFLSYRLKNHSNIKYTTASMRFFIRDKKKMKRTAEQDKEIMPVFVKKTGAPEDSDGENIVVVFKRITIAEQKHLAIELTEQNGDRNPFSYLGQKVLLKARLLQ